MKRTTLKQARAKKKITQKQLAKILNLNSVYVSQIERGIKDPSLDVACKLEKLLGVPVLKLLKKDGDE